MAFHDKSGQTRNFTALLDPGPRPYFIQKFNLFFAIFRSSNGCSNESLESLNLSSEDAESDREMDIEEEEEEVEEEEDVEP